MFETNQQLKKVLKLNLVCVSCYFWALSLKRFRTVLSTDIRTEIAPGDDYKRV